MIALLINASPYGSELPYNALRVATALELSGQQIEILLVGDGVNTARRGQTPRTAHAPLEPMLAELAGKGVTVMLCGTCCQTRGLQEADLADGVTVGTIHDIARVIGFSDKVVSF